MSIFREMHPSRTVDHGRDYSELKRMLSEAITRGHVEQIPVMLKRKWPLNESWYREKETGIIFSLVAPDERSGSWDEIAAYELADGYTIQ